MGNPVYVDELVDKATADDILDELMAIDWERRDDAPRFEFYCNDTDAPYTYGRGLGERTYHPRPWPPCVIFIRDLLDDLLGVDFDVCFLNRYDGGHDHLGWHSDDSPEMDPSFPIVTVSFGIARPIDTKPIEKGSTPTPQMLGHGSAFVMPAGFQQTHKHRIPKLSETVEGTRVSMTFRRYLATAG